MRGRMQSTGAMGAKVCIAVCAWGALAMPALARDKKPPVPTQMIVTVVSHERGGAPAPTISSPDVRIEQNGKKDPVLDWKPLPQQATTQLVVLIDDALQGRSSANFSELQAFILHLPSSVDVALGYMQYGRAMIASGFDSGKVAAAKSVRIPTGIAGVNASPYFCISDLAKHWPDGGHPAAVRQVLMITDGIDRYFQALQYDPQDPYVGFSIVDAQKSRLIVSAIYFRDIGFPDRGMRGSFVGNDYLIQVAQATGGKDYYEGMGNPVTFVPMLREYTQRLASAYVLSFGAHGSGLQNLRISTKVHGVRLDAPDHVVVGQQLPMVAEPPSVSVAKVSQ